jgi:hypothetical protein
MTDILYNAIMEMKEDVGGIKADVNNLKEIIPNIRIIESKIGSLESYQNRQRGAAKVVGMIWAAAISFAGFVIGIKNIH